MKSKKSQIFLFDLILSLVIVLVTLGILFSYYSSTQDNLNIYDLNLQIMSGFSQTKVNSLNNEEVRRMFVQGQIRNIENTVAQQVAEFTYNGRFDLATNLSRIFLEGYLPRQYNMNLSLNNGTVESEVFSRINRPNSPYEESDLASSMRRTIYGFINQTDYYGPYRFTIRIWS